MKAAKEMGEVRVKVKLFNAGDEILVRRGLLKSDQIRTYETEALVDTGAVRSVIPAHVREHLGLALIGERVAEFADGRNDMMGFTEPIRFELLHRDTFDDALVVGNEVLIGQTVLEKTDLLVDCARNRVIPNPAHPDQPVNKIK
jgi:predicted aspartyl protease